jgi:hypothetical protein
LIDTIVRRPLKTDAPLSGRIFQKIISTFILPEVAVQTEPASEAVLHLKPYCFFYSFVIAQVDSPPPRPRPV